MVRCRKLSKRAGPAIWWRRSAKQRRPWIVCRGSAAPHAERRSKSDVSPCTWPDSMWMYTAGSSNPRQSSRRAASRKGWFMDDAPAREAHHVHADSGLTDERIRVLKHGDTFALFDERGDIR